MPLKLSGYALSYPQLNKLLESSPVTSDTDPTDGDMDIFTQWGPVVWLNRWLEEQGMGKKLQAVPVYDPVAASMDPVGIIPTNHVSGVQSPGGRITAEIEEEEEGGAHAGGAQASGSKEGPTSQEDIGRGDITGQSLLLVRKCVFEERLDSGQRTPVSKVRGAASTSTTMMTASPLKDGEAFLQRANQEEPVESSVEDTVESSTSATCPYGDVHRSYGSQGGVTSHTPTPHLHHHHQHEKVGQAPALPSPRIPWLGPPVVNQSRTEGHSPMPTEVEATPARQPAPQAPPGPARMIDDINEELAIRRWIAKNILGDEAGDAAKVKYVTVENPYFEEM